MKIEDLENQFNEEKEHRIGQKIGLIGLAFLLALITTLVIFL